MSNLLDDLRSDLIESEISGEEKVVVKAEDIEYGSSIDFKEIFFEPQVGQSYTIKFLPSGMPDKIPQRTLYKNLPDPERKGKTFRYTSSGNANTCEVLSLFFELYDLKKNGDAVAEKKIEKYLKRSQQGCARVQILSSPVQEDIGRCKLFVFPTFGPNSTISNLIDKKLNPSKKQLDDGAVRENIFNIFESSVMNIECVEKTFDGEKGRDFTSSEWLNKKRGAIVKFDDGSVHEFTKKDLNGDQIHPDAEKAFAKFAEMLTDEKLSIFKYFAYKEPDDERLDKDTKDYLEKVLTKVKEIVPVIREKTLSEIAAYGKVETNSNSNKNDNSTNILEQSVPAEIGASMMNRNDNQNTESKPQQTQTQPQQQKDDVEDILNQN